MASKRRFSFDVEDGGGNGIPNELPAVPPLAKLASPVKCSVAVTSELLGHIKFRVSPDAMDPIGVEAYKTSVRKKREGGWVAYVVTVDVRHSPFRDRCLCDHGWFWRSDGRV
jgi:hypothetical protein